MNKFVKEQSERHSQLFGRVQFSKRLDMIGFSQEIFDMIGFFLEIRLDRFNTITVDIVYVVVSLE